MSVQRSRSTSILSIATCRTHRLRLERLNSLDVRAHVVRDGLEFTEDLLGLVNNALVPENGAIVLEVDRRGLRRELRVDALGIAVPLAERLESRNGLCYTATP